MSEVSKKEFQNLIQTWTLRIEGEADSDEEERLNATYQFPETLIEEILQSSDNLSNIDELVDNFLPAQAPENESLDDRKVTVSQDPAFVYDGYRLDKEIGRGGMGVVTEAVQFDLQRKVAIKIPHSGDAQRRFVEEAIVSANLTHPNIISVHELVRTKGKEKAMVMQLVEGEPWSDRIYALQKEYPNGLPFQVLEKELEIFITVAQAISYAHSRGVLHNDLKLSNVMVGAFGDVSVMDWGCATLNPAEQNPLALPLINPTRVNAPFGSPVYMSPEQAKGLGSSIGVCTDVYLLGGVLYEIVMGHPTRNYGPVEEVIFKAINGAYEPLAEHVSSRLKAVIHKALDPMPRKRYATANDLIEAVRQFMVFHQAETLLHRVKTNLTTIKSEVISERNLLDFVAMHSLLMQCRDLGLTEDTNSLLEELLALFVDTALAKGDLNIATVYAEQLSDTPENKSRKQKIRKAKAQHASLQKAKERNQRMKIGGLLFVFVGLLAVLAVIEGERGKAEQSAEFAAEQTSLVQKSLKELQELSDTQKHRELMLESDSLWPARPEKKEDMALWLSDAQQLLDVLPRHRQHLEDLRQLGTEFKDTNGLVRYRFKDATEQWVHNTLSELVVNLEQLEQVDFPQMKARLAFASSIAQKSIIGNQDRWDTAIAAIQQSSRYGGLTLTPQLGLVPLGENPDSGLWEFWHIQSGVEPQKDRFGDLSLIEGSGIVLVLIPEGEFWMGANKVKNKRKRDGNFDPRARQKEMPSHKVSIGAFFLSKYELTQAQWLNIMGNNPAAYAIGREVNGRVVSAQHPIEQISWSEAMTAMKRYDLTLPTEAQWEYGNRAGTQTIYWTGDTVKSLQGAANISDQQSRERGAPESWAVESVLRDDYIIHGPVGQFRANPFGLHDTSGNVWEWCADRYGQYTYPVKPQTGERIVVDDNAPRLFRGGGFRANSIHVRSADRYSIYATDYRAYDVGIRPARMIED